VTRWNLAISSLVIEVLILVLTAILIPLVIVWVVGLWHTTEQSFSVIPIVRITQNSTGKPVLDLRINNNGNNPDTIVRVAIRVGNGYYINATAITIPGGFTGSIMINSWEIVGKPQALKPGEKCRVYIYTKVHGMLFYDVVVST